jgi:hypothetical protein
MAYSSSIIDKFVALITIISISSCCNCPSPRYQPPISTTPYYEYDNSYQYYSPQNHYNPPPSNYYDYDSSYQYISPTNDNDPFNYPVAR